MCRRWCEGGTERGRRQPTRPKVATVPRGFSEFRQTNGRWVIYARDEERIRQMMPTIMDELLPAARESGPG